MSEKSRESLAVYKTLIDHLTRKDLNFKRDDEKLTIEMIMRGDDLPMEVRFQVIDERKVMRLLSILPFRVSDSKRVEIANVICKINDQLLNGCFDYNEEHGLIIFRLTQIFIGSLIGEETIQYMIGLSLNSIEEYNDKFFMFSQGKLTAEEVVG